jgi:hypothetical protein
VFTEREWYLCIDLVLVVPKYCRTFLVPGKQNRLVASHARRQ